MDLSRRRLLQTGAAAAAGSTVAGSGPASALLGGRNGLDALRGDLRGRLLLPGDAGFSYAAWPNNARWADRRPRAIAMCAGASDVRACIDWARQEGQSFAIRSGGHNYAGFSTTDGLLIDVKPMSGITVDTKNGRVAVKGWKDSVDLTPEEAITWLEDSCAAFLYTHVDTEGTMQGFPIDVAAVLRSTTAKKLIVAGGIREQVEVEALDAMGVDAVAGMALYSGAMEA